MEVGNPDTPQKEESYNQEGEEVEINLSADIGMSLNPKIFYFNRGKNKKLG